MVDVQHITSLLKLYLLQKYDYTEWLESDLESCEFFRARIAQKQPIKPAIKGEALEIKPTIQRKRVEIERVKIDSDSPKKRDLLEANQRATKEYLTTKSKDLQKDRIQLEPKKSAAPQSSFDWKEILHKTTPSLKLLNDLPTKIEPKVFILSNSSFTPLQKALLQNIALAITLTIEPAVVVNEAPTAEAKLVLGTDISFDLEKMLAFPEEKAIFWQKVFNRLCPPTPLSS